MANAQTEGASASQVPFHTGYSTLSKPVDSVNMPVGYAKAVGQMAYIWGWPMVNMFNRRAGITQAAEPGLMNGVVPVAPRGRIAMLTGYVKPLQTFIACPNQDVAYGLGYFALDVEPVVIQVPDFGDRSDLRGCREGERSK